MPAEVGGDLPQGRAQLGTRAQQLGVDSAGASGDLLEVASQPRPGLVERTECRLHGLRVLVGVDGAEVRGRGDDPAAGDGEVAFALDREQHVRCGRRCRQRPTTLDVPAGDGLLQAIRLDGVAMLPGQPGGPAGQRACT
jgi:hypothetical protein